MIVHHWKIAGWSGLHVIRQRPVQILIGLGSGYVGLALGAFGSRISPHSLPLGVMVANMLQALFWAWFLAKSIQFVPT